MSMQNKNKLFVVHIHLENIIIGSVSCSSQILRVLVFVTTSKDR